MRVLITNNRLDKRGGAESYVRELARGLQSLGHSVIAYTSDLRQQERLLESDLVPVSTDLERLPFRPDIIHGQHHLDAITALIALPGVPAIYYCHGAVVRDAAPQHPRIYRYLAMSTSLAERLAIESNIPASRLLIHLNGVDLGRFAVVREPPVRPRRALLYNRYHYQDSPTVLAVREAAQQAGLELDCIGDHFENRIEFPEEVLPSYDIVFASGRSAIEALACGCAVVVLGRTSCGEMVNSANFDRFRSVNFSIAVNSPAPSVRQIVAELHRFDAADSAAVTKRIRAEADSNKLVKSLVGIYDEVIQEHRATVADPVAEMSAVARYLRWIVPLIKVTDDFRKQNWEMARQAKTFTDLRAVLDTIENELRRLP